MVQQCSRNSLVAHRAPKLTLFSTKIHLEHGDLPEPSSSIIHERSPIVGIDKIRHGSELWLSVPHHFDEVLGEPLQRARRCGCARGRCSVREWFRGNLPSSSMADNEKVVFWVNVSQRPELTSS